MAEKNKNILFVTPPYHCGVVEVAGSWPPLGFLYLGAQAERAGWNAAVYDAMTLNHNFAQIENELKNSSFDILATSSITPTFPDAAELCRSGASIRLSVSRRYSVIIETGSIMLSPAKGNSLFIVFY
jgi:anaerobic magnesium-protoporphyrin IX monomethyl ester cyclase